ncbi:MAG: Bax inhibitor-1/YccA family protein [Phycisphaeraceae bacterium]|nr:MAG: Bax inhibitor-1/YccA family protein [Phycisphaeraceae bacterium]
MLRTSNPAMKNNPFGEPQTWDRFGDSDLASEAKSKPVRTPGVMTLQGTINKSFFLLAICIVTAVFAWDLTTPIKDGVMVQPTLNPWFTALGGVLVAFVLSLITTRKPQIAPGTAPAIAVAEGVFVGAISASYASWFASSDMETGGLVPDHTIVLQAALCTFGVFAAMLTAYTTRLIKPTEKFKSIVVSATLGIMFLYIGSILMSLFGMRMPLLHDASPIGIAISAVIIVVAALNLVLDFEFIETGVKNKIPTWGEWFGGFTLLITLVWLYFEFLRLLWKIRTLVDD